MYLPLITPSPSLSFCNAAKELAANLLRLNIKSVLVGVSGGADSVLTLRLLIEAQRISRALRIHISHVNFSLRGEESDRDEEFVKLLAESAIYTGADIHLRRDKFDTIEYASTNNISIEMAARDLRHNLWRHLQEECGIRRIVTGHNADDNEETLLLNLMRGASPHGLRGMSPVGDTIIRPLLYLNKETILRLLAEGNRYQRFTPDKDKSLFSLFPEGYVTDSTNRESDYRRNFLRNEVIPLLKTRWRGIHTALQTTLRLQSDAASIVDFAITDALAKLKDHNLLPRAVAIEFPAPGTLIYYWQKEHGITPDIAEDAARHLCAQDKRYSDNGARWPLDNNANLVLTRKGLQYQDPARYLDYSDIHIEPPKMLWGIMPASNIRKEDLRNPDANEIFLPYGSDRYEWRTPQQGDRMALINRKGSKLVSDILKEGGVPLALRHKIQMLVNIKSGKIIWIPGIRRGGDDLIPLNSKKMIHYLKVN